jgi:hypothetical protein
MIMKTLTQIPSYVWLAAAFVVLSMIGVATS